MEIYLRNQNKGKLFAGMFMRFLSESTVRLPTLVSLWVLSILVVDLSPVQAASEVAGAQTVPSDTTREVFDASLPGPSQPVHPLSPRNELEPPATTVEDWIAQIAQSLVQITDVRVEATETGLQIVLETADGELSIPTPRSLGNALVVDILDAVLALLEGDDFLTTEPAQAIALISTTNLSENEVEIWSF